MPDNHSPLKIIITMLPEEERDPAWNALRLLMNLQMLETRFEQTLALIDHSLALYEQAMAEYGIVQGNISAVGAERYREIIKRARDGSAAPLEWIAIAQRDAAITIYDFGLLLDALDKTIRRCPTLLSLVDTAKLDEASDLFSKSFPKAKETRHAAAHMAELGATPEARAANAYRGKLNRNWIKAAKGVGITVTGTLVDGVLHFTRKHEMLQVPANRDSLSKLRAVRLLAREALTTAETATRAMLCAQASNRLSKPD